VLSMYAVVSMHTHSPTLTSQYCPPCRQLNFELSFAGIMSGNLLHLPVCTNSDEPSARSCLKIPRQCSTQMSQYHSPLQKHAVGGCTGSRMATVH
jgi:hypothetical protein